MGKIWQKQSFLGGAVLIALGGFISKLLGALYRIPLTNILGGRGMGIYQMVYPLYCLLLTISASGIPTGLARLVSAGEPNVATSAFRLYGVIGAVGSLLFFLFARPLAFLLGEGAVASCCQTLAPAVFFVSIISVVRGYFQGYGNMLPTALSEVCEQLIKVSLGCVFALYYATNLTKAVSSTLFAVTLSELVTCFFLVVWYRKVSYSPKPLFSCPKRYKTVLQYTLPLTLMAGAMPLGNLIESIITLNILRPIQPNATAIWGVYTGCAVTIINLPVSIAYGLSASAVPQISPLAQKGEWKRAKTKVWRAFLFTLVIALPSAVIIYLSAPLLVNLIFSHLTAEEKSLVVSLCRVLAVNTVTLSLGQTSSACLTALGKPRQSAVSQWFAMGVRVLASTLLLLLTHSIYGVAVASIFGYLVAFLCNLWYIIRVGGGYEDHTHRFGYIPARFNTQSKTSPR